MIVTMQHKGRSITGLTIGRSNAHRYFPFGTRSIDLELDHLRIRCELGPEFWHDHPEISDPRLCTWLEGKLFWKETPANGTALMLERSGECYRLRLLPSHQPQG